ncbi:MAG TPA: sterol desaturase family protein [Mesorhizobium sp.]|jgi:sterol desaturase/sphingolipid hydroxylase (fatty acid hydroxylase superfamily)|nr:sterol desaturase family protein [Mesorhizobium sp.]
MEAAIRLGAFLLIFVLVALAEWRFPKRDRTRTRKERWRINLGILALDVIAQRLTVGAAAFAAAVLAQGRGWGLFNLLDWPFWLEALLAFLALDLAIYLQHVASHAWAPFWRLHQVHHADLDVDLTTGIRFHPVEIVASALWKALVVLLLGADPWTVILFEAVLNASAVYTHGNISLPERADRALRLLFCTPDMHRVHHSVIPRETHSNFGFFLSVWDRLFRTMRHVPERGHEGMELGLPEHRDAGRLGFVSLMRMPFRRAGPRGGEPASGRQKPASL